MYSFRAIKAAYQEECGEDLIEKIRSDTSGDFERLIVSMASTGRDEETCDISKAQEIAKELHDAG